MIHPETLSHPGALPPRIAALAGRLLTYEQSRPGLTTGQGRPYAEILKTHAFAQSLRPDGPDVAGRIVLPGLDPILISRSAGTLRLKEEVDGVTFEIRLAGVPQAQQVIDAVAALTKISFTHAVSGEVWIPPVTGPQAPSGHVRQVLCSAITAVEVGVAG